MDGVILIYKEKGWTSRDVCNKIQRIFNTRCVGHLGTLDPFAEGLLICTINNATKIAPYVEDSHKTYIASLFLGEETETGDNEGKVISKKDVPSLNKEDIIDVLKSFLGKQKQIPPMTSAVHYQGVKLYEMAHDGIVVDRPPRDIEIYDIKLISYEDNHIIFEATVSKGTYLRVLGEDIAKKLGTVGYLDGLLRTKINDVHVKDALKINEVTIDTPLIPISKVLTHLKHYKVGEAVIKKIKDGQRIYLNDIKDDIILIVDDDDKAIAIYQRVDQYNLYRCLRGLW